MSRLRWLLLLIGGSLVMIVLVTSIVFLGGVYYRHWEGPFVHRVAHALPIPAAKVAGHTILLRDYLEAINSIKQYLSSEEAANQNQRRPIVDNDRKNALDRLIQEEILNELAASRNVTVTDQQVDALMAEINVTSTSTEAFTEFIKVNYGWSMEDFKDHVARPLVLTRLLGASFAADHGGDTAALEAYVSEQMQKPDVVRYLKFTPTEGGK